MITAVLDWEMSTLGDPLADLGLALVYWADADDDESVELSVGSSVTAGPGFLSRLQVAERYAALTGRDVSRIGYYWPSAVSSWPWYLKVSMPGSCSTRRSAKGSSRRAQRFRC